MVKCAPGSLHNRSFKGIIRKKSLSLLIALTFLLASCQAARPSAVPPVPTISPPAPSPSGSATSTSLPTVAPTLLPSLTPEPAWYQGLDPSLGVLKYQYADVTNEHARIYASFDDAVAYNGNFGYLPKFPAYVAYTTSRTDAGGQAWYLVNYGWISGADLQPLVPSTFSGLLITRPLSFRFGWVLSDVQSVSTAGDPLRDYKRYQVVQEIPSETPRDGYVSVGADEWLPVSAVTLTGAQVPADAGENTCRFIHVDLTTEILRVYDHCQLIFATLVSSGKNSWTFEGRFAVLYKVEYSSITPPAYSTSEYYIEGLPYFMTYAGNFGFHAAYWHDNFGAAGSHGCINLAPVDAKWLYDWAGLGERVIISPGK
jgi:lipoprotein-anchoring transpeptidase ErfK/SrfK